jgi:pimeloyl-ACP methyl ester carboxylesterase
MHDTDIYEPVRRPRLRLRTIRGIDLCISEWGRGTDAPIFYLHGWGDAGTTFQFVVDALGSDHRVIAPDWRGFGRSGHAGPAYWFPDYLADLDALIHDFAADAPVLLVGHSMGANVAGLYAAAMPERVRGFVNIEGFGLSESEPATAPEHYRRWLTRSRTPQAFSTFENFDGLVERIVRRSPRLSEARARFVAREWAERGDDGLVRLRADPAHKLPNAVMYRRAEAEACWAAVKAPVLLVSGADTEYSAALGDWLDPDPARRPFPGARSEVVENTGHMVHFEAPERLASLIEGFLGDL